MICNCSLAGTAACRNCNVYLMYYDTSLPKIEYKPYEWFTYWADILKPLDSDRYELVEKKDWKINNLKKELKEIEDNIEQKKLEIESCNIFIEQYEKDLEVVNSKLKELETNNE